MKEKSAISDLFKEIPETRWSIIITFLLLSPIFSILQLFVLTKNESCLDIYRKIAQITGGLVQPTLVYYWIMIVFIIVLLFLVIGKLTLKDLNIQFQKVKQAILFTFLFWCTLHIITGISSLIASEMLTWNRLWAEQGALTVFGLLLGQLLGNAIYEEVTFRGFLLPQIYLKINTTRSKFNKQKFIIALVISQVCFSLIHIPHRILHEVTGFVLALDLFFTFLLGIIFALLFVRTKNLFIAIGIHSLLNYPTLIIESPFNEQIIPTLLSLVIIIFWPKINFLFIHHKSFE